MANSWINSENMLATLQKQMNDEMMDAAEPIIKKAIEDAEKEMRKRLASMFVSMIDQSFNLERYGQDLRITVRLIEGK